LCLRQQTQNIHMWIFCVCASKHNPTCGKNKKKRGLF